MSHEPAPFLDAVDLKLLDSLRLDGRMPLGMLGDAVGLSGDAVRVRLKRLTAVGAVKVVGSVDPAVLGLHTIALVGVVLHGAVEPFAESLVDVAEFDLVSCTIGSYDLLLEVVCRDEAHLMEVLDEHVRCRPEVSTVAPFVYLDYVKFAPDTMGLPHHDDPEPPRRWEFDEHDLAVISALQADGRLTYQEIAARTGLPYQRARRHAKALLDQDVVRIHTTVNRLAEGSAVGAAVGLRTLGGVTELHKRLAELDEVEVAVVTAGPFDMFLDVVCRDRAHLARFVGATVRELEGVVSTETFIYTRLLKLPQAWSGLIRSR